MSSARWSWAYWSVFGLGLAAGLALLALVFWRLQRAYELGALTRDTLTELLGLSLASLSMLVVAGWAQAHRPREVEPPAENHWAFH